ncbi:AraC family transcriptional regulator [Microbaculum marinum]|uniref:AraC family transcriptional regulator n=1 Tax=Microbaculum marinum TaxID=1764581 RepID=A0AAW9RZB8_9HYPH
MTVPQFAQLFAQRPTARHTIIESNDPVVVNDRFASEFTAHQLEVTRVPRRFKTVAQMVRIGGATLYRVSSAADIRITASPMYDRFVFYVPVNGNIQISRKSGSIDVVPGQIGIANPSEPFSLSKFDNCSLIALKVSRDAIEREAESMFASTGIPLAFDANRPISAQECPLFLRLLDMIHADLVLPDDRLSNASCSEPTEALLIRLLLRELPNNQAAHPCPTEQTAGSGPVPYYVRRVEQLMANDARRNLSMDELVAVAGVSARTLYAGFRQYRGVSPMRRLREVRLANVRADLAAIGSGEAPRRTVTEVASDWGFNHMGDFSSAYRERFGEAPSKTLKPRT